MIPSTMSYLPKDLSTEKIYEHDGFLLKPTQFNKSSVRCRILARTINTTVIYNPDRIEESMKNPRSTFTNTAARQFKEVPRKDLPKYLDWEEKYKGFYTELNRKD